MSALEIEYSRASYMGHAVDHHTYYGQFATDEVVNLIRHVIGEDRIKASTDQWFNDIPLGRWDRISGYPRSVIAALDASNASTTKDSVRWHSLSDLVCIAKAAARKIRGW